MIAEHATAWAILLPMPPSLNSYYKNAGRGKRRIDYPGLIYRRIVKDEVQLTGGPPGFDFPLAIDLTLHPRDFKVRDIDNYSKCLYDALDKANVFTNDALIRAKDNYSWGLPRPGRWAKETFREGRNTHRFYGECFVKLRPLTKFQDLPNGSIWG